MVFLQFKLKDMYENPNHMVHVHLTNEKSCNLKFIHSFPKWIYNGKELNKKRQIRSSFRLSNISLCHCVGPSNYIKIIYIYILIPLTDILEIYFKSDEETNNKGTLLYTWVNGELGTFSLLQNIKRYLVKFNFTETKM